MAGGSSSKYYFFFLLFFHSYVKGSEIPHAEHSYAFIRREPDTDKEQRFPSIHRAVIEYLRHKMTELDSLNPPTTAVPSAPVNNPVTAPPYNNTAPGIVTVPGMNPVGVSTPNPVPTNPGTNPTNPPAPITNPVTTPSPTNPVTTPSGGNVNPAMPPPMTSGGNAPAGRGQGWCTARNGASQAALQSALDYACGIGGADCSAIQQGATCYEPVLLQNHASYAFNSYYQKNPVPTSCDFGGAAAITTSNPSTGSCIYPSSSTSSTPTTPTTQAPVNPTSLPPPTTSLPPPTTSLPPPTMSSTGSTQPGMISPPPGFSLGNTDPGTGLGAFGASPPLINKATVSNSLIVWVVVVVPFISMLLLMST